MRRVPGKSGEEARHTECTLADSDGNGSMSRETKLKASGQDITIVVASRMLHCDALTRARTAMGLGRVKTLGQAEHVERRSSSTPRPRVRWQARLETAGTGEQDSPP